MAAANSYSQFWAPGTRICDTGYVGDSVAASHFRKAFRRKSIEQQFPSSQLLSTLGYALQKTLAFNIQRVNIFKHLKSTYLVLKTDEAGVIISILQMMKLRHRKGK